MPDTTPLDQQFNTGIPIANQKADDFVLRNPTLVATIKSAGEQLLEGTVKDDLLQSLKVNDNSNCGACPRDDFINSVFDNIRGVKASDLMKLLSTFADEYEELVSFDDFIRLVERQGQVGGLEY